MFSLWFLAGTKCGHEEELLREVLLGLGLQDNKLSDLRNVTGVEWRLGLTGSRLSLVQADVKACSTELPNQTLLRYKCDVRKVDLRDHLELQGSLIPALLEFQQLEHLILRGTEISGDLAMVAKCNKLITLDLSKTSVAGELKAIANAVELSYLSLADTKVEGDIKALQNATELRTLDVANTNVFGDMASLRDAKYLQEVNINGTRITGARCF